MTQIELYSANVCPYAHRTRLALLEKGVDFTVNEIDLNNKPDWFTQVSPYSKVPVIKYGDDRIWESSIINEYIEEVFPQPFLMPQKPGQKATARIWIDFANTKFNNTFYKLLLNQEPEKQQKWAQELLNHLLFMEQEGLGKLGGNGPYWLGESVSLVDLTFYPWFERWVVLEHYRNLSLPAECTRLKRWQEAMQQRDCVKAIANPAELYIKEYEKYANNTATGITAQEMRDD